MASSLTKMRTSPSSSSSKMLTTIEDIGLPPSPPLSEASMASWDAKSPPRLTPQVSILDSKEGVSSEQSSIGTSNYDWPVTSSEKLIPSYALKTDVANCHRRLDNAFPLIASDDGNTVQHGLDIVRQVCITQNFCWACNKTFAKHLPKLGSYE